MKVMRFNDSIDSPALIAGTAPEPVPGPGEVLVRLHAAGVTPSELTWYPTTQARDGGVRSGAIPGHEFSGVIQAVGAHLDANEIGQDVFGMNDWFADGATADYCTAPRSAIAVKPSRLSHAEAASVPIGVLTAWQGLLDRAKVQAGERVLIHGGSGAVGVYAIQLARRAGARITTSASPRNFELLRELGADEVIDYRAGYGAELLHDFDVVFDSVGGETLKRSWDLLKPDGRMVTIVEKSEGTQDDRTAKAFFIVEPNRNQLTEIAALFDAGHLRCFVDAVVPFSHASDAYSGKAQGRRGQGKVVISLATD